MYFAAITSWCGSSLLRAISAAISAFVTPSRAITCGLAVMSGCLPKSDKLVKNGDRDADGLANLAGIRFAPRACFALSECHCAVVAQVQDDFCGSDERMHVAR